MRARRAAHLAALVIFVGCGPTDEAPDVTNGVPVADRSGEHVGTADPSEFDRAVEGGPPAPVYRDGEHVGDFGPDGYEPLA